MSFVARAATEGVRPNQSIVVHARTVKAGASLVMLAGQALTELTTSLDGITDVTQAEILFDDGQTGLLFLYSFPARGQEMVRQYHALRLDDDQLTTLTLTARLSELDESTGQVFLQAIASLSAKGPQP